MRKHSTELVEMNRKLLEGDLIKTEFLPRISASEDDQVRVAIQVGRELPERFQEAFSSPDY